MKIEAGKYYRMRGGSKAYVAAVGCPFGDTADSVIGWMIIDNPEAANWSIDGLFHAERGETSLDLVEEVAA